MLKTLRSMIEAGLSGAISVTRWLAIPIAALLCLQWPLRDVVQMFSREANDFAQVLFAVFVAVSVTAATRAHVHIAADTFAHGYGTRLRRRIEMIGFVVGVLPWCLFLLWSGAKPILQSVGYLERFPDTANPGYFIVKLALLLMVVLILLDGLVRLMPAHTPSETEPR
jgi:TRAP-type mannitol/chloroaromatic compound transport system permease small subunit